VNANNQCVLKTPGGLLTTTTGGASISPTTSTTSTTKKTGSTTTAAGTQPTHATSPWTKQFDASGSDFFSSWNFWDTGDPTNGLVDYLSQADAQSQGLIEIDSSGNAIMRVSTTPVVQNLRPSVRIESNQQFTQGIWIMDATHMPTGCGTWPAFWTLGPNWPYDGEIDIVEGINADKMNQATLHTVTGCYLATSYTATGSMAADTNCSAYHNNNAGCGLVSTSQQSYGAGFNANGGGVFAMQWIESGISVWFFPRGSIPSDITNEALNPSNWGTPMANFPPSSCDPNTYFRSHTTVFDITLCGDWAGNAWNAAPNGGGQTCAQSTGVATCQQYVLNNGAAFSEAYWSVASVKIYQQNT